VTLWRVTRLWFHLGPAQIQITVFEAQGFVNFISLIKLKGQRSAGIEQFKLLGINFDSTDAVFSFGGALRTLGNFTPDGNYILAFESDKVIVDILVFVRISN
jgi:hypothetical protein